MDHLKAPIGRIDIPSAEAMDGFGASLAATLGDGSVLALGGGLGAGKSTLARGLITAALTATGSPPEDVPSPTFTLVQPYPFPSGDDPERAIWHMDLWRLENADEIHELGLDEALARHVSVIEWPEKISAFLPGHTLLAAIEFDARAPDRRAVRLSTGESAVSDWSRRLAGLSLDAADAAGQAP